MQPTASAYPLEWPVGWKRTPDHRRREGKFTTGTYSGDRKTQRDITLSEACDRLYKELERMAINMDDIVISTNVQPTLSGRPRSGERKPTDPGAAVYWVDRHTAQGKQARCMAIDAYTTIEQNVAALAATIDAMRAIERHGGAVVLDRAFMGFAALPAPMAMGMKRPWRDVLELNGAVIHKDLIENVYRELASRYHPDRAPDGQRDEYTRRMAEINVARDEALQEL